MIEFEKKPKASSKESRKEKEISISEKNLCDFLEAKEDVQKNLHQKAAQICLQQFGKKVFLRGLLEFSNLCENDCYYCGLRKSNTKLKRYCLREEEILQAAEYCAHIGYGSILLQSGEMKSSSFLDFVYRCVETIHLRHPELVIVLSIGEQEKKVYEHLYRLGARRYLLRIETSQQSLYSKIKPCSHSFERRVECLHHLREIGFQVGTGVMVGLPNQTCDDMQEDLLFLRKMDCDMIGLGPYLPHSDTPFGKLFSSPEEKASLKEKNVKLALNMMALARILMPDVNIAATSALQSADPRGWEKGLLVGANVVMPIVTPQNQRAHYQLYDGKPCINETPNQCSLCWTKRITKLGLLPAFGEAGCPPHYLARSKKT
jgi:biotin synthase